MKIHKIKACIDNTNLLKVRTESKAFTRPLAPEVSITAEVSRSIPVIAIVTKFNLNFPAGKKTLISLDRFNLFLGQ
jgi:dihydropteroate synthase